jgi:hypothetical protein
MFKYLRYFHLLLWLIWAILIVLNSSSEHQMCFQELISARVSYRVFFISQLIFMFGGGWILLALLVRINKYFAYAVFESVFISIIFVQLRLYLCR